MPGRSGSSTSGRFKVSSTVWASYINSEPLPHSRCYAATCVYTNQLYVIGGCDERGEPVDTVLCFDGRTWSFGPKLNAPRSAPTITIVNQRIFVIGGIGAQQAPMDSIEMFEGTTWEKCPSLPEALMGVSSIEISPERAFIVGGMAKDTNPRDSVRQITWTFSQERPKWDNFPPMPTARYNAHLEYYHETIFAVGGRSGKRPVSAIESLELKTNQWTSWMNIPTPRVFAAVSMAAGHLIITGGLGNDTRKGFKNKTEIIDIAKKASVSDWFGSKRQGLHRARGQSASCTIDGHFIVFGGFDNSGKPCSDVEVINLRKPNSRFSHANSLPYAIASSMIQKYKDNHYIIGGVSELGPSCQVIKVNFERDENSIDMFNDALATKPISPHF